METRLSEQAEAELIKWAVTELLGWTEVEACTCKAKVRGLSPDGKTRGHVPEVTRSLDASRLVVLAVKAMGLEPYIEFIDALKISPGLIERAVSGGMERGDPDSVGVNLACGIVIGLESDPLEIILAAHFAVTGQEFSSAASGERE